MRDTPGPTRTVVVDQRMIGDRLDALVARACGVSVAAARRMLAEGAVQVNSKATRAGDKGARLAVGTVIEVAADAIDPQPVSRADLPLGVLASGDGWVAVDKLAGVATHPLKVSQTDTMLSRVAGRYPQVIGVGEGGLRSGVVHRLDLPTTGALLFATHDAAFERLRAAFVDHTITKTYHALVRGVQRGSGEETMTLAVTQHRPAHVSVVAADHPDGRLCSLAWRAQRWGPGATLIHVDLHTGFLHQVRVMLAAMGHPLLGDGQYGDGSGAARVMLHAAHVAFEEIDAAAPWPADFEQAMRDAGLDPGA